MRKIWLGALLGSVAAPLAAEPVTMWFSQPAEELSASIANLCAERSAVVIEQDQFHVLCSREMSGMSGILAQALIGNSRSTTPELKIRFGLIRSGKYIRVQATQWIETQMAFGQVQRQQLDGRKQIQSLRDALGSLGGTPVIPSDATEPVSTSDGF